LGRDVLDIDFILKNGEWIGFSDYLRMRIAEPRYVFVIRFQRDVRWEDLIHKKLPAPEMHAKLPYYVIDGSAHCLPAPPAGTLVMGEAEQVRSYMNRSVYNNPPPYKPTDDLAAALRHVPRNAPMWVASARPKLTGRDPALLLLPLLGVASTAVRDADA